MARVCATQPRTPLRKNYPKRQIIATTAAAEKRKAFEAKRAARLAAPKAAPKAAAKKAAKKVAREDEDWEHFDFGKSRRRDDLAGHAASRRGACGELVITYIIL